VALDQTRTAICPVTLTSADYHRAHDACYRAALLWNQVVGWVHKAKSLSVAQNRATPVQEYKPMQANPSASSLEPGPLAVVA
jgi:hypothetical protein